jgi:hypothetical protein
MATVSGLLADDPFYPDVVDRCLNGPTVKEHVTVLADQNPVYLRGDFDGDGLPDYALPVKSKKTNRNGVLICSGNGQSVLLGAATTATHPFSSMPDDNFVAPSWAVYRKAETATLRKYSNNVPNPFPDTKGEVIAMIWEDGISVIYWDGKQFRWAPSRP